MRRKIHGKLKNVVDFDWKTNKPVVWSDVVDEKNNYHFTVETKQHFMELLKDSFDSGSRAVIFLDGEDMFPHFIINKPEIKSKDLKWLEKLYRGWSKQ